jgi:hypothetical protein
MLLSPFIGLPAKDTGESHDTVEESQNILLNMSTSDV